MSLCGSCLMISRSLHVPGSPSSALTTKYFGLPSVTGTFMNDHLRPVGKPAPPRPRRPESLTCCWIHSGPLRIISFVLYQSPRDSAPKINPSRSSYQIIMSKRTESTHPWVWNHESHKCWWKFCLDPSSGHYWPLVRTVPVPTGPLLLFSPLSTFSLNF